MLPNLFPDRGTAPEYNSVDASLWYIIAVRDLLDAAAACPGLIDELAEQRLRNEAKHQLFDVVDVDHHPGVVDPITRPNQIFAVGGLPLSLLSDTHARQVVDSVETQLWTPAGLRSLGPSEPGFAPRYAGTVPARDSAYHQGTVWPWLAGAFIEAWVRVRGNTSEAKQEARKRYLEPLRSLVGGSGLNHLPEITDSVEPYTPPGSPFQAWPVGEVLRLDRVVLRLMDHNR